MSAEVFPDHMDRWSRNLRLYETLKGMGLYVSPIPEPSDPTKIKEMIVSVNLPIQQSAEQSTQGGVVGTVQRSEVRDVIRAAESSGANVINFPTVL